MANMCAQDLKQISANLGVAQKTEFFNGIGPYATLNVDNILME